MENKLLCKLKELELEELEYNLDENLDSDEDFIDSVLSMFMGGMELELAICDSHDKYVDTGYHALLESAKYIENDINRYIQDIGVDTIEHALKGGQCNYYTRQLNNNESAFYTNAIINHFNNVKTRFLDKDDVSDTEILLELPLINCEEPMDIIEAFIAENIENSGYYASISTIEELVNNFNEFAKEYEA